MKEMVFVNSLTLSRILLSMVFYLEAAFYPDWIIFPILISLIIFLTDFLDGRLARRYNVETRAGAVFDVIADIFFIIISFTALIQNNILPVWILAVAILKFTEFCITSLISPRTEREIKRIFIFDKLGRAAAILLYSLPVISLLSRVVLPGGISSSLVIIYCSLVTLMGIISSAHRITLYPHQKTKQKSRKSKVSRKA